MVVEKNGLLVCLCWSCLSKGVGQLPPPLLLNLLSCPHLPFLEPGPHKRVGVGAWPGSPELWARPHCAGYRELPSFYSCRWLLSLNPIQCHLVASTPRPAPFVTPQEGEDHLPPPNPIFSGLIIIIWHIGFLMQTVEDAVVDFCVCRTGHIVGALRTI